MHSLTVLTVCILATVVLTKTYTLRGDANWPTSQQIAAFKATLTGPLVLDTDANYKPPSTYNLRAGPPQPAFLVKPANEDDIAKSLAFASTYGIRVSVRSTGHHFDLRNTADQSIQLDMSYAFNKNTIDIAGKTVTVQPGQAFSEVHKFVKAQGNGALVALSGAEPAVGPGGWSMGGGHGRLTRLYGLGVDALVSINLVLANGTKITTSESLYPELFRALRGSGGHTYGVATSLTFKLFNDPGPVNVFNGFFSPSDTVANAFQTWMKAAPNNANAYYITGYDGASKSNFVQLAAMCFGDTTSCGTVLAPLAAIPGCGTAACKVQNPYTSYNNFLADNWDKKDNGGNSVYMVSGAIDLNTAGQMATITAFQTSFKQEDWATAATTCFVNSVLGGASAIMDTNGTLTAVASAMRQSIGAVTCGVGWKGSQGYPDLIKKMDNWGDTTLRPMSTNNWVYWGEPQHNFANNDWMNRYWGGSANYARLRAVKQLYDPNHVMTCYHCVGWEDITNVDPSSCPNGCSCSNANTTGVCMRFVGSASSISVSFVLYGLLLILYFLN